MIAGLLAVAALLARVCSERLDRQARTIVHPEFTAISLAFYAYAASWALALAAVIAAVVL